LREGEFAPNVQYNNLSLIIRKGRYRSPQVLLSRMVLIRRVKPR